MCSYGAVSGLQMEHWLVRLLRHWHQTTVVFQQSQFVGIVVNGNGFWSWFRQHVLSIVTRYAIDPFVIGLDRSIESNAVLKNYVTEGSHASPGQLDIHFWLAIQAITPFFSPFGERRPKISQALKREQIGRQRHH